MRERKSDLNESFCKIQKSLIKRVIYHQGLSYIFALLGLNTCSIEKNGSGDYPSNSPIVQ